MTSSSSIIAPARGVAHRRRRRGGVAGVAARPPAPARPGRAERRRSEEHTSELQSRENLVCRLLLEKKKRGGILKDQGRLDEAIACYREALAQGGDADLIGYFLASLVGRDAPESAPPRYVRSLFDDDVKCFDKYLVDVLRYEAPCVLVDNLRGVGPERFAASLDLGCGTGLCAPLLKPVVFFFNDTATTEIYTLSLHDALPI